jgi:cell division protein FtsZ
MGAGQASGENRAVDATQQAISSPLLEEATIKGARGVLINITGGLDLTLYEVNAAATIIRESADENANIIFGAVIDENLHDEMRITVIATGFAGETAAIAASASAHVAMPPQPRYIQRPVDDTPRPMMGQSRADDLDVPTFIRKKAD